MEKDKKSNTIRTWLIVSVILNIYVIILAIRDEKDLPNVKHIKSMPKDTLWENDTAFVITSKIDTSYYDPKEQPPEDYR